MLPKAEIWMEEIKDNDGETALSLVEWEGASVVVEFLKSK